METKMSSSTKVAEGAIDIAALQSFRASLRGQLILPSDESYDTTRMVYNAMIDKKPAVIVRCAGAADVISAVNFARVHNLLVAVRSGGHSVSGKSVCDGGIVIDLSLMKGIRVNPSRRTAQAQTGLRLGEFDRETQAFGLATPTGLHPNTGIAGLTLGGGIGWLNGLYGLACDNLISVDVVTADGRFLIASERENQDLFWGVRGGGGNFGIVTSFEYRLHPVNMIVGGEVWYDLSKAKEVLRKYHEFALHCPDELSILAGITKTPDRDLAVFISFCYAGPFDAAEKAIAPLQTFDKPLVVIVEHQPYLTLQGAAEEAFYTKRYLRSWKGNLIRTLSTDAIAMLVACAQSMPAELVDSGGVELQQMHGAASRVDPSATAFAHRYNQHDFLAWARWTDPAGSEKIVGWVRESWQKMQPFVEEAVYSNDLGDEGTERVKATYGINYERLLALKNKYDPGNLFRLNQNIEPSE
jgi:FAD/FMN-containing dehydrogenase